MEAVLVILMLIGASWGDLQERRVRNRYWIPFIVVAAILWLDRLADLDAWLIGGALAMTVLAYALWWFGLFGGADAKGLMVFAWLWPGTPDLLGGTTIPVLDTMVNAALAALALPFVFLVVNVLRGDFAFPAMVLGIRMEARHAQDRHVWPMQEVCDGAVRWRFMHRPAQGLDATYAALRIAGVRRIWTTPKIPFMIPLAAGAVVTMQWGNIVVRALLGM